MIQHCTECDKPFHVLKGDTRTLCRDCTVKEEALAEAKAKEPAYGSDTPPSDEGKKS